MKPKILLGIVIAVAAVGAAAYLIYASPLMTGNLLDRINPTEGASISLGHTSSPSTNSSVPTSPSPPESGPIAPVSLPQGNKSQPTTVPTSSGSSAVAYTIPIGHGQQSDVAVDSSVAKAFVPNDNDGTVSVISLTGTPSVTDTIHVGQRPLSVAVDTALHKVYVVNQGSDSVTVLDDSGIVTATSTISNVTEGQLIRVDSSLHKAFVSSTSYGNVIVIDTNTDTIVDKVKVGTNPVGIGINPSTHKVYIAIGSKLVVMDGTTDKIVSTITTGLNSPFGVGVNVKTNKIYVTNFQPGDGYVSVIDGNTDTWLTNVDVGSESRPYFVDCSADTCYATTLAGNYLAVIGPSGNATSTTLYPGPSHGLLGVAVDSGTVYVSTVDKTDPNQQNFLVVKP